MAILEALNAVDVAVTEGNAVTHAEAWKKLRSACDLIETNVGLLPIQLKYQSKNDTRMESLSNQCLNPSRQR